MAMSSEDSDDACMCEMVTLNTFSGHRQMCWLIYSVLNFLLLNFDMQGKHLQRSMPV